MSRSPTISMDGTVGGRPLGEIPLESTRERIEQQVERLAA